MAKNWYSYIHWLVEIDAVKYFSEQEGMQGGSGRFRANGLFLTMLDHMGHLPNYNPLDAPFLDVWAKEFPSSKVVKLLNGLF